MFSVIELLIPLALGVIGWYVAERLKAPAAGMLGPMVIVGAGAMLGLPMIGFPAWAKVALQVVVGIYVGARVTRGAISEIKTMGGTVALVTGWTVFSAMVIGYLASVITNMDLASALLGSSPGGMSEMTAMALAVGADVSIVAVLHTFRVAATMAVIPLLARRNQSPINGWRVEGYAARPVGLSVDGSGVETEVAIESGPPRTDTAGWLASFGVGIAGAVLMGVLPVPGGVILGSLLAVALANVVTNRTGRPPMIFRLGAQIIMGTLIGTTLTTHALNVLLQFLPTFLAITISTLASSFALSNFVRRRAGSDTCTALLACAPAGLSQMAIIADEMGADMPQVTVFQLTRYLCSIIVLPIIFKLLI